MPSVSGLQDRFGLTRSHGRPALRRRPSHGCGPRPAVDRPGASACRWPVEREDRRGARNRHHGEDRQRDRQREPRQDHRVIGSEDRPCRSSRPECARAATYSQCGHRISPVPSPRRGSEKNSDRPGRSGPEIRRAARARRFRARSTCRCPNCYPTTRPDHSQICGWHGRTPSANSPDAVAGGTDITACRSTWTHCRPPSRLDTCPA